MRCAFPYVLHVPCAGCKEKQRRGRVRLLTTSCVTTSDLQGPLLLEKDVNRQAAGARRPRDSAQKRFKAPHSGSGSSGSKANPLLPRLLHDEGLTSLWVPCDVLSLSSATLPALPCSRRCPCPAGPAAVTDSTAGGHSAVLTRHDLVLRFPAVPASRNYYGHMVTTYQLPRFGSFQFRKRLFIDS